MKTKRIITEDFTNYKKPSMFIAFPKCSFKCDKECNLQVCHNSELAKSPDIEISYDNIINRYLKNNLTEAIVFGGLEPFDSLKDLYLLVNAFRLYTDDDIVIYTGYKEEEIREKLTFLKQYPNIIIKFGRFIPNQEHHFDEILGVELASPNQYAKKFL